MSDPTVSIEGSREFESHQPEHIGPYHILELLGEGGMGEVYKAERRHPMRQTVAIKIIRLGFSSKEVIARFESERQALARMDHPNVARVLDAGVSDTGRPYFVMEHVPGVPITQFCDDNKFSIRDRLLLFCQACEAIAHAHAKAIIHRDIKAGNVLAYLHDGKPTVKVIDFGIAKALTGDRLTDATFNTDRGHMLGTIGSMSPEQADGSPDIDTRTDVYSLGVLLYELLTGVQPFDHETLARAADDEIKRIIRDVDPSRPSTRLSSMGEGAARIAEVRGQTRTELLSRELRGELEWIPLKAMRKERERRYVNPTQLAEDVQHYLHNRPLLAGPESTAYRLKKFVSRRRAPIAAALLMFAVLAGASVIYVRNIRLEQSRTLVALTEARSAQSTSDAVNRFLKDMLQSANPANAQGKPILVRDVINNAEKNANRELHGQPLVLASVLSTMAATYYGLGESKRALAVVRRAAELYRAAHSETDRQAIDSAVLEANILLALGQLEEAEALCQRMVVIAKSSFGENDRQTLQAMTTLGLSMQQRGKLAESERVFVEVLKRRKDLFGEEDIETLNAMHNLAYSLAAASRPVDAEPLARQALEGRERLLGDLHPDTITSLQILGTQLQMQGRFKDAEPLFTDFLKRSREVFGANHQQSIFALAELGRLQFRMGDTAASTENLRRALELGREVDGPDNPNTLQTINDLAFVLLNTGRPAESEPLFREALDRRVRTLGADHPASLQSTSNLAMLLFKLGPERYDEAIRLGQQVVEGNRRAHDPKHVVVLAGLNSLCDMLNAAGESQRALPLAKELYDVAPQAQLTPANRARFGSTYGLTLMKLGRWEESIGPLAESYGALTPLADSASKLRQKDVLEALVQAHEKLGRHDEAARWKQKLSDLNSTTNPSTAPSR